MRRSVFRAFLDHLRVFACFSIYKTVLNFDHAYDLDLGGLHLVQLLAFLLLPAFLGCLHLLLENS